MSTASKTIAEWCEAAHGLARDKGWHETPRSALEVHMLIVSEVAEASEQVRSGEYPVYQMTPEAPDGPIAVDTVYVNTRPHEPGYRVDVKPEGEAVELADAVLRIMDYFGSKGWDLEATLKLKHEYNKTRSHRHGGKRY